MVILNRVDRGSGDLENEWDRDGGNDYAVVNLMLFFWFYSLLDVSWSVLIYPV